MNEENKITEMIDHASIEKLMSMYIKFSLGELAMSDKQAEAATKIIDKAIPDLKPISFKEAFPDE